MKSIDNQHVNIVAIYQQKLTHLLSVGTLGDYKPNFGVEHCFLNDIVKAR